MSKSFKAKSHFAKLLLSGVMISSILLYSHPALTAAVNDIDESSAFARESILAMAERNIIEGDQNGNFNPRRVVTRSEMVKILVNVLGIDTDNIPEKPSFTDVPTTHWSYGYVEAAYREGIVKGLPDGSFGKDQELTREQLAAMLVRSVGLTDQMLNYSQGFDAVNGYEDSEKIANWAKGAVDFVLSSGLMNGTASGTFSPKQGAERQQVAVVANRFLENKAGIQKKAEKLLSQVLVVLNGDAVDLAGSAFKDSDAIYVPVAFFEKMGAETEVDSSMSAARIGRKLTDGTEKSIGFGKDGNNGLKVVNGEAFVPLEIVVQALGASCEREQGSSTVYINDAETVKYPFLFKAINENMNFRGSFSSSGVVIMENILPGSIMEINFSIDGAINGDDYRTSYKMTSEIDGIPDAPENIDITKAGENVYVKMGGNDKWIRTSVQELEASGLIPAGLSSGEQLITADAYGVYEIIRAGKVTVGGEKAVKYVLNLDRAALKKKISQNGAEKYDEVEKMLDAGMDIKVEVYVNDNGQVVREIINYGMTVVVDSDKIDVKIEVDRKNSDIGRDIEIKAPEAISDLTLEDILNGSV